MKTIPRALLSSILALTLPALYAQTQSAPPDPHSIPSVDAGIGSCSADFTITDSNSAPVYNAKIKVHIAYGFWSVRKLDLEVSSNADGKARVTGLPNRLKRPLSFQASEADREAEVTDDPSETCAAKFTLILKKKPS